MLTDPDASLELSSYLVSKQKPSSSSKMNGKKRKALRQSLEDTFILNPSPSSSPSSLSSKSVKTSVDMVKSSHSSAKKKKKKEKKQKKRKKKKRSKKVNRVISDDEVDKFFHVAKLPELDLSKLKNKHSSALDASASWFP